MKATFPKQYKKIQKAYTKKLLAEHKANSSGLAGNLNYFVTYLKMLRDYNLLTNQQADLNKIADLKTTTLVAAVSEYEKYQTCIFKYYKVKNNSIERLTEESEEAVSKKYNEERKFHWINFWQLVMTNIED
jgi:hypothetical protein